MDTNETVLPPEDEVTNDTEESVERDEERDEVESDAGFVRNPTLGLDPQQAALGVETFDDLPLHPRIREAVQKIGWREPTPVQKLCLPFTLRGRDVAGFAQTGTGKTAVFLMTIANRLLEASTAPGSTEHVPRAIVLAPTRELAMQIEQDAQLMFEHTGLVSMAVFGGIDYDKQARQLKDGVDVIFATPGRLMDYVRKKMVDLQHINVFVCDEADRMFDMGFIEDVEFFLERIPEGSQKLLFSATTNEQVKELAFEYLEAPEYISVNPEVITPEKIEQHGIHCHATDKLKVIIGLLREHNPECSIVFTNTKLTAEWLHYKLVHNGIEADLITGDLPQKKRIRLIQTIKEGKLKALIATDVASRGLHISRVTHVYNFDLPDDPANYVHRIGRTARAGARGFAYSLVCDDYGQNLAGINELLGPTGAIQTIWPKDDYLAIEDKAGNPFEDRYARRERADGGRQDRPARHERGGDRGRGGPHGRGRDRGEKVPFQREDDHALEGARLADGQGKGKRRRRRGGHKGAGETHDQQQGREQRFRDGNGKGRHDRTQQGRHGGKSRVPAHHSQHAHPVEADAAPKSFGGVIKKLFKTLFGIGK